MIDLTKTYKIEPKVSLGDLQGLDKEGLSRHVGTIKQFSIAYNELTRKYKTGLDENAPEILTLPKEDQLKEIEWIKATKANLEKLIGQPDILNPTNDDFWSLWTVDVEVGVDKKLKLFGQHPFFNPNVYWQHALALITMKANDTMPFSKKESGNPKYKDSQFYLTTSEEEVTMSKDRVRKSRDRAKAMSDLFDGTGQFDKASKIAYLLNVQKEPVGIEKLEEVLEIFSTQPEYLDKFLALFKMEDSELELRTLVKKAIDCDEIKFNSADKIYYRGGMNLRNTEDETVKFFIVNMSEPLVAKEIAEIKAAVNKKEGKKRQKAIV